MHTVTSKKCNFPEAPFKVQLVRFASGERLPLLIRNSDGQPLFMPTVYATTILRGRSSASKTIEFNLRAIMHLYTWAAVNNMDIESLMSKGHYLSLQEVESLAQATRLQFRELMSEQVAITNSSMPKVISLECFRVPVAGHIRERVDAATAATRIIYIREYLSWLSIYHLSTLSPKERAVYEVARKQMLEQLNARKPSVRRAKGDNGRMGLTKEVQELLVSSLRPNAPGNPWKDVGLQYRNELLVAMLMHLGLRRGEELGITSERINMQAREVHIIRNADDAADPRTYEPNTKTKDRTLPLDPGLAEMIHHYVVKVRSKIPGAHKHKFLFVAHDKGRPLSISAFSKVFATLRSRVPGLPEDLTAHVLRHTWNDRFSELMDELGTPEAEELKLRCYHNGWADTSKTAAVYTQRSTRQRAKAMSLKLQNTLAVMGARDGEEDYQI